MKCKRCGKKIIRKTGNVLSFPSEAKKLRDDGFGDKEICPNCLTDSEIEYLKEKLAEMGLDPDGFDFEE